MQTGVFFQNGQLAGCGGADNGIHYPVADGFVKFPHAVDVLFKMTAAQKPLQGMLLKAGDSAAVKAQVLPKFCHKLPRQHHIADTDGGGKGFGEGV